MRHIERHRTSRIGWLRAAVLGANDGIVSTASLMLGVAAAHATQSTVLITGIAGLVAGAMSMAAEVSQWHPVGYNAVAFDRQHRTARLDECLGDGSWSDSVRDTYVERVLDQLKPHISNLESASKFRLTLGPAQLASLNTNLVGGDPYAGDCRIDQFAPWRPLATGSGHRTPIEDLWQIGASTHPGPGLGGGSGYLVATRLTGKK